MKMLDELENLRDALKRWFMHDGGMYQTPFFELFTVVKIVYCNSKLSGNDYATILELAPTLAHKWAAYNGMDAIAYGRWLRMNSPKNVRAFIDMILKENMEQAA